MEPLEFARRNLFGPLEIDEVTWEWNGDGYPMAWARMWLKPDDMAKLGLLYLQRGQWDGEQVISADWVRATLIPSAFQKNVVDILDADMTRDREASTRNWVGQRFIRPFADGYGYQWWLDRDGNYSAVGTSGQYIMVSPEQVVVFVVTAKSAGLAQFFPATLFYEYVLPAVASDEALPQNEAALARLEELRGPPVAEIEPTSVAVLPAVALEVSGRTYTMDTNPFNTNNIRFVFDPDRDSAELSYTARERRIDSKVGLDGVYRVTTSEPSDVAAVGSWTSPNTFAVQIEIIGYSTFDAWEFIFEGDVLTVNEHAITGDYTYEGVGEDFRPD